MPSRLTPQELRDQRFAETIAKAIVKGLEPLLSSKNARSRPSVYNGSEDGLIDGWISMMRHYLSTSYAMASPIDQAWKVIEYLESESRDFVINKSRIGTRYLRKIFSLLSRRFGNGSNSSPNSPFIRLRERRMKTRVKCNSWMP